MTRPLGVDDLRKEETPVPRGGGLDQELARWRNATGSRLTTGRRPR